MKNIKTILLIASCMLFPMLVIGQSEASKEEAVNLVRQIYTEVSGDTGDQVNWDKVRSFFAEEAVIVLRTSREGSTQFTVEEFIQDFKDFYNSPAIGDAGFKEEVLRIKSEVYGDIAFIAIVYEASILDSERPPQKGIDFWLLSRRAEGWKIVSVINEIIPSGQEIPEMFEN